jgi:uncharacterized Fe-S cluster-containing radical SAM superfamily protein
VAKPLKVIDTERFSSAMRARGINTETKEILITNFRDSIQEQDLSVPANCNGYGRIRHFRYNTSDGWPSNSLPILPAARALGTEAGEMMRAQVFQNATCNWRCWYCFVDFKLLSANPKFSSFLTADQLLDLYEREEDAPAIIDLSGGQPDLVPEWIPWMMQALEDRGLNLSTFLWSDDNLSNDYLWQYLDGPMLQRIEQYRNYGKVCCFKGFDARSFAFNTKASADLFDFQFEQFSRLMELKIDLYCYATFTAPSADGIADAMSKFVDRLQNIHPSLPLRTVPLEIAPLTPVTAEKRLDSSHMDAALHAQQIAIGRWMHELDDRFSEAERAQPIVDIPIR